jgi:hypothetical protein
MSSCEPLATSFARHERIAIAAVRMRGEDGKNIPQRLKPVIILLHLRHPSAALSRKSRENNRRSFDFGRFAASAQDDSSGFSDRKVVPFQSCKMKPDGGTV